MWIGEVVTRNVGHPGDAIVNMVLVRVVDNVFGSGLGVTKKAFFRVDSGQVDIYHFGVVPDPHLKSKVFVYVLK